MSAGEDGPRAEVGQFRLLDHPADLRLRLQGASAGVVYRTAVVALSAVLTDQPDAAPAAPDRQVEISLSGTDPGDLLACLLNEALFLLEDTGALPVRFEPARVSPTELSGALGLLALAPERAGALLEVKAATYGELRWDVDATGAVLAEITLDL